MNQSETKEIGNMPSLSEPRIILADDHSMIRKGLKLYLQLNLGLTGVDEASTCSELMRELVKKKYTHLVLDIILTDGSTLEIIPNIRRVYPDLRIMVFSMQPPEIYAEALKQYGITHYLSKTAGEEEIIQALKKFVQNEKTADSGAGFRHAGNPFTTLAPRELEILHYLLKGVGTKNIAETLNLKMSTVSTIKNRIFEKTNAGNLKELLELASLYNVNY